MDQKFSRNDLVYARNIREQIAEFDRKIVNFVNEVSQSVVSQLTRDECKLLPLWRAEISNGDDLFYSAITRAVNERVSVDPNNGHIVIGLWSGMFISDDELIAGSSAFADKIVSRFRAWIAEGEQAIKGSS